MTACFNCGVDLTPPDLTEAILMEEEYRMLFEGKGERVLYCNDCFEEGEYDSHI